MFHNISGKISYTIIIFCLRILFPIRYKLILENLKNIERPSKDGVLFLSNHCSLLDGLLIGFLTWHKFDTLALVLEDYYFHPMFRWFFVAGENIRVPNFATGSTDLKEKELKKAISEVANRLKQNKGVIIFPSGKVKTNPLEKIGGNSFLYHLFQEVTPGKIVLVRISGYWGSVFSYGQEGKTPSLAEGWGERMRLVLSNGIFFMPKRPVILHFEEVKDLPHNQGKIAVNKYLQDWYNAPFPEGEPLSLIPYHFWEKRTPAIPAKASFAEKDDLDHPIFQDIASLFSIPASQVCKNKQLGLDLGLDSLDLARLAFLLEAKYDLPISTLDEFDTVNDLVRWVEVRKGKRPAVLPPILETVSENIGVGDLWNQPMSYAQIDQIAEKISKTYVGMPLQVGVMLHNSLQFAITFLALHKARKRPVLINWLFDLRDKEKIHKQFPDLPIITSKDFLNSLNQVNVNDLSDHFHYTESLPEKRFQDNFRYVFPLIAFDYFEKEKEKMVLKTFSDYSSLSLDDTGTIAVIHHLTTPQNVARNLFLLSRGATLYLLSSYRITKHELSEFLNKRLVTKVFDHSQN